MVSMIISELYFFKIEWEVLFRDAMEFNHSLFGITPEAFEAININFIFTESNFMINFEVAITTEHQGGITFKLVGIDDRAAFDGFDCQGQETFSREIGYNLYVDFTLSLEDTEDRDFVSLSPSAQTFSSSSKVGLIHLYFAPQPFFKILALAQNSISYDLTGFQDSGITQGSLLSNLACLSADR